MLLRRITQHVRNQNWFALFLDFIIVVVGVFIGIQVANWNQALKDKQDELIYLERMHEDIRFAKTFAEETINRRLQHFERSVTTIDFLKKDKSELSNEYVDCVFPSSNNIQIDLPFINTIKELLETGKVNLLSDAKLRSEILELQSRSELLRRFQDQSVIAMINLADEFSESVKVRNYRQEDGEIRKLAQCDLKALFNNNRFINAISDHLDIVDAFINKRLIPWSDQINKLDTMIEQSLQKHQ